MLLCCWLVCSVGGAILGVGRGSISPTSHTPILRVGCQLGSLLGCRHHLIHRGRVGGEGDGIVGGEGAAIAGLGEGGERRVKGLGWGSVVSIERIEAHFFDGACHMRWDLLVIMVGGEGCRGVREGEVIGECVTTVHGVLCMGRREDLREQ